jgi:hypothetical protein
MCEWWGMFRTLLPSGCCCWEMPSFRFWTFRLLCWAFGTTAVADRILLLLLRYKVFLLCCFETGLVAVVCVLCLPVMQSVSVLAVSVIGLVAANLARMITQPCEDNGGAT